MWENSNKFAYRTNSPGCVVNGQSSHIQHSYNIQYIGLLGAHSSIRNTIYYEVSFLFHSTYFYLERHKNVIQLQISQPITIPVITGITTKHFQIVTIVTVQNI